MKRLMLLAAGAAALSLAACDREVRIEKKNTQARNEAVKTLSKLDCPETQGDLKRISAAADGLTCVYQAENAEVTLRLVALKDGDARAALSPIEDELRGLMPKAAKAEAPDDGDKDNETEISLPGLHIKADDHGAKVQVGGGISVDADDDGAEVRIHGKGEAVRSTFILSGDRASEGYGVAGYEARGAKAGPLVVAIVKAKGHQDGDDLFDDMKDLVKRNTDA